MELDVCFLFPLWGDHGVDACDVAVEHVFECFGDVWFVCVFVDDECEFVVALHHVDAFFVAKRVFDDLCHCGSPCIVVSVNSVRRPGWLPGVRSWKVSSDGVFVVIPGMLRSARCAVAFSGRTMRGPTFVCFLRPRLVPLPLR